jgi:hypothetical protein
LCHAPLLEQVLYYNPGEYIYFTPSKHGSVEIIKENDGKISLKAKDGTIFVFDIRNRSFE